MKIFKILKGIRSTIIDIIKGLGDRFNKLSDETAKNRAKILEAQAIMQGREYSKSNNYNKKENMNLGEAIVFELGKMKIAVSKKGDIVITTHHMLMGEQIKHINIEDILDIDIMCDDKLQNSIKRGAVGGVLFGGIGLVGGVLTAKKKKIKLILRINDFYDPEIFIEFGDNEVLLQKFLSILKVVEKGNT